MGVDAMMMVKLYRPLSAVQVRQLSYEACASFMSGGFLIDKETDRHAMAIVNELDWGDEPTLPVDGEQFIELSLSGRFYGVGYERGDFSFYKSLAEWLEFKMPGARVFYGGDSDVGLQPFGEVERGELWRHFCEVGQEPYRRGGTDRALRSPKCEFCHASMVNNRWGPANIVGFECMGCGETKLRNETTGQYVEEPDPSD